MRFKGYMGKILRLDLTKKKYTIDPLTNGTARLFLGGNGFAVKILFDELKPGLSPYDPENKIVFATGPIN